ncbi:hypothetical protein [Nocardia sp. NPDC057030]|uniref:hypothetical protein n=1 Tax=unclassified Nocardia TaxID=2637762 RepID=UPI00363030D5
MTPWLPLISSLIIASVTLFGVRINNRTNRTAIFVAEEREYRKWQRETVLRQCTDAVETALTAEDAYRHWLKDSARDLDELRAMTFEYSRKLCTNASVLEMLNAHKVAGMCTSLQQLVWSLWESGEDLVDKHFPYDTAGFFDELVNIDEIRCALVQFANAEVHGTGRDSGDEISPMRARFLRAHRPSE